MGAKLRLTAKATQHAFKRYTSQGTLSKDISVSKNYIQPMVGMGRQCHTEAIIHNKAVAPASSNLEVSTDMHRTRHVKCKVTNACTQKQR